VVEAAKRNRYQASEREVELRELAIIVRSELLDKHQNWTTATPHLTSIIAKDTRIIELRKRQNKDINTVATAKAIRRALKRVD
jgi:hypothetical protein